MRTKNPIFIILVVATIVGGAILLLGAGAEPAWSDDPASMEENVCLDCHDTKGTSLMGGPHDLAGKADVSCTSCHTGTEAHLEDEDVLPTNPSKEGTFATTQVCLSCHAGVHATNTLVNDPHTTADLSCTACHQVHDNKHAALLKDEPNALCLDCHASARSSFAMPTHHPVDEGVVECRDCHIEVAQSKKQRTAGGPGETCVKCHGSFQGPFPYEHEAAVNYSVNEGGCLNCHNPHGSTFPMLLKQSYESPHYSLCSQCHSVPKHLNSVQHGTMWQGVPCSDCHVDIHGSYVNRNLLDPSLETQGCFLGGGGCHEF